MASLLFLSREGKFNTRDHGLLHFLGGNGSAELIPSVFCKHGLFFVCVTPFFCDIVITKERCFDCPVAMLKLWPVARFAGSMGCYLARGIIVVRFFLCGAGGKLFDILLYWLFLNFRGIQPIFLTLHLGGQHPERCPFIFLDLYDQIFENLFVFIH